VLFAVEFDSSKLEVRRTPQRLAYMAPNAATGIELEHDATAGGCLGP
jgi:hypothetical protein